MVSGESASGIQFGMALTGERNAMDANEHARKGASMSQELKPCPFCGGPAELICVKGDNEKPGVVVCMSCEASGPEAPTGSLSIAAWNKRSVEMGG